MCLKKETYPNSFICRPYLNKNRLNPRKSFFGLSALLKRYTGCLGCQGLLYVHTCWDTGNDIPSKNMLTIFNECLLVIWKESLPAHVHNTPFKRNILPTISAANFVLKPVVANKDMIKLVQKQGLTVQHLSVHVWRAQCGVVFFWYNLNLKQYMHTLFQYFSFLLTS